MRLLIASFLTVLFGGALVSVAEAGQSRVAYTLGGMPNMPDGDLIIDIVTKRLQAFGLNPTSRQQGTELRVEFDDGRTPEEAVLLTTRPGSLTLHSGVKSVDTCEGIAVKGMDCLPAMEGTEFFLLRAEPDLSGNLLERAEAYRDTAGGAAVNICLTERASRDLDALIGQKADNPIAVVIDGAVLIMPKIQSPVYGREIQILGPKSQVEAWSVILSLPPLPQPLSVLDVEKVTPK
ncbi:MAG: hypothetical protein AAF557_20000 [Pseudomonadota bacterium]